MSKHLANKQRSAALRKECFEILENGIKRSYIAKNSNIYNGDFTHFMQGKDFGDMVLDRLDAFIEMKYRK